MNTERLSLLASFLKDDPNDPFNWYAMAMEFKTIDQLKAKAHLDHLIIHFPDYLPTYFQLAELLIDKSEHKEAIQILEKGIDLAKHQKNLKTQQELQSVLTNLLFDDD